MSSSSFVTNEPQESDSALRIVDVYSLIKIEPPDSTNQNREESEPEQLLLEEESIPQDIKVFRAGELSDTISNHCNDTQSKSSHVRTKIAQMIINANYPSFANPPVEASNRPSPLGSGTSRRKSKPVPSLYSCLDGNAKIELVVEQIKPREFIKCDRCSNYFASQDRLEEHKLKAHRKLECEFYCDDCKRNFRSQEKLDHHYVTNRNHAPLPCPHCPKKFWRLVNLRKHVESHEDKGTKVKPKKPRFQCPKCKRRFFRKFYHKKHMEAAQRSGGICNSEKCKICGITFTNYDALKFHWRTHIQSSDNSDNTNEESYSCSTCSKIFNKLWRYISHQASCSTGEEVLSRIQCKDCKLTFLSRKHLIRHRQRAHGTLQCDYCVRKFWKKSNLQIHLKSHSVGNR